MKNRKNKKWGNAIFLNLQKCHSPIFSILKKMNFLKALNFECAGQPRSGCFEGIGVGPQQAFLHWIRIHALLAKFIPNSVLSL